MNKTADFLVRWYAAYSPHSATASGGLSNSTVFTSPPVNDSSLVDFTERFYV